MDIYREVDVMNDEIRERTGKNLAPMVKYILDDNVKELPKIVFESETKLPDKKPVVPVRSKPPP